MKCRVRSAGSTFFKVLCLVQVLCSYSVHVQATPSGNCVTNNGTPGVCISIGQCPQFDRIIENSPLFGLAAVISSICSIGFFDFSVCCPLQENSAANESQGSTLSSVPEESSQFVTEDPNDYKINHTVSAYGPLYPPNCGFSDKPHNRVVGGYPAALGAWPWIAALGLRFQFNNITDIDIVCGAALISSRHVVTAAHCLEIEEVDYFVRLGARELENATDGSHSIDVFVEKFTIHPNYSDITHVNDVAVLRLKEDVKFTDFIHPICLPLSPELRHRSYVGTYPFVAGWGSTSYKGPTSNVLMEVQVPVVKNSQCAKDYANKNNTVIDGRVLCAGYAQGGKDACQGDSGGPLMFPRRSTYYLIGVVSTGFRCAQPGYPGIYTRVTAFLNFILSNLN